MSKRQAKTTPAEDKPSSGHDETSPTDEVAIQSRVHRPLLFRVPGHGSVRLDAFASMKLPASAIHRSELRALVAEGAVIVVAPPASGGAGAAAGPGEKGLRGGRGERKHDDDS